ncbi:MAG: CoA pyrophosphatase [Syntrophales bacterium]|jgi:8-oxo-dGTP pyrophosphatase MutT (NUDIX family)|nr:CoA pyrophosphatase [Syntrophales bacterium]MDY0044925.1 CoA pyrophosphatase [Syntrophales bacterium]
MNLSILEDKEHILAIIKEKLGREHVDYTKRLDSIKKENRRGIKWQAAGVLLPLYFKPAGEGRNTKDEFVLQLIKRSSAVSQGGDISAPGGMLNPYVDNFFKSLILMGIPPVLRGEARRHTIQKGNHEYSAVALFLANALRESWEEIRLNPFNVNFLGALPFQDLFLFTRTIFPIIGEVKKPWQFRPNTEVDKVIEIPLHAFFKADNYATYCVRSATGAEESYFESPCFICQDEEGLDEILWGATLRIVMNFIEKVFPFAVPEPASGKFVNKTLYPEYLKGNGASR